MPLTQAEMDFMTNHAYELHNFERPMPAHEALRALDPEHTIKWDRFRLFQYLWQEQARREGPDELSHFWLEPTSRSSFTIPWPTVEAFHARYLELYPEEIFVEFEANSHPLRYPRYITHRSSRSSSCSMPIFSPEENVFLDAYYEEIRSCTVGPCLTAVDELKIPHGEVNHLVGYRATELLHEGLPWPQSHPSAPPIPWPTLEVFKLRFFPPRPNFPWHQYVPLNREEFSAKERTFFAHYLHEITTLTPGPAHDYLDSQSLSPILMIPFLKHTFRYCSVGSSSKFSDPAGKFLTEPLPAFEIPWGTKSIFFGRVLRFCDIDYVKRLVEPFLPPEDSAYVYKPFPYAFLLSQEEEGFIHWYLAEIAGVTGDMKPATQWLWSNGVYPSTLEAFLHVYRRPLDHFHDIEHDKPLPTFRAPWLAKEDFEARLKGALEDFPALKDNPAALPGYLPESYEERRLAWLRSIPNPPALDSFPAPKESA